MENSGVCPYAHCHVYIPSQQGRLRISITSHKKGRPQTISHPERFGFLKYLLPLLTQRALRDALDALVSIAIGPGELGTDGIDKAVVRYHGVEGGDVADGGADRSGCFVFGDGLAADEMLPMN